jgi:hypothetical protein
MEVMNFTRIGGLNAPPGPDEFWSERSPGGEVRSEPAEVKPWREEQSRPS